MFTLDQFDLVSQKEMVGLHAKLIAALLQAADILKDQGIYFRVYQGLRNAEQQNEDFAKGRDALGHIINLKQVITYAKAGQSSHNYGLAVDAVPFNQGKSGLLIWSATDPKFRVMVAAMRKIGLGWSGTWQHNPEGDLDHFYIGPNSPTVEMESVYNLGLAKHSLDLPKIWADLAL